MNSRPGVTSGRGLRSLLVAFGSGSKTAQEPPREDPVSDSGRPGTPAQDECPHSPLTWYFVLKSLSSVGVPGRPQTPRTLATDQKVWCAEAAVCKRRLGVIVGNDRANSTPCDSTGGSGFEPAQTRTSRSSRA
ncbi:hypothetical protein NOCARDAX2BIS_520087 [Nocardioides sp. AX2bis]|nr:hypothetical protein NOCARDAX2BIS_520087 [Nocardioides sp. AX2bis]